MCNDKLAVAAKVIRLNKLEDLPISIKDDPTFKILYLVRDPRGMANSRFNLKSNKWTPENLRKLDTICSNHHKFLNSKATIKSKIFTVRYEDFALNPVPIAEQIYDFVGLNMTTEI